VITRVHAELIVLNASSANQCSLWYTWVMQVYLKPVHKTQHFSQFSGMDLFVNGHGIYHTRVVKNTLAFVRKKIYYYYYYYYTNK
jgi:hypothetical protein